MREEKHVIIVDPDEQRVMVKSINGFRYYLIERKLPTEDVDSILMKVIDAPTKKQARKAAREAR